MQAISAVAPPADPPRPSAAIVLVLISAVAGVVLGAVDLGAQKALPYPWADLANTSAVWAVAAFAVGCAARRSPALGALAGVVLLVVAVEAYYLAAVVWQHDSTESLTSPSTQAWLAFAGAGGALFGSAGAWSRGPGVLLGSVAPALAGSVLYAEALVLLRADQQSDRLATAVLEAVLGVVVVLVAASTNQRRALALLACVPLTALGYVAYTAAGFGG